MGKVIAKRFIFMIPVVLAVTFIIFMLSFIIFYQKTGF